MARVSKPKADGDGAFLVAITSACLILPDGIERMIYDGRRYRSSDPAVKHAGHLFVSESTTHDERDQARRALVEAAIAAVER